MRWICSARCDGRSMDSPRGCTAREAIRGSIAAVMLSASGNHGQTKARVWDVPVRVSHWLLAACVLAAWLTRDPRAADLHSAAGYCALVLVAFRLAWGWIGTRHARFSD